MFALEDERPIFGGPISVRPIPTSNLNANFLRTNRLLRLNRSSVAVAELDYQVSLLRRHAPKLRNVSAHRSLLDSLITDAILGIH